MNKTIKAYAFALLACVPAFFLTKWIKPVFDTHFFELFQAAVVLSAWYGGLGPGILAASVSFIVIDYFFLHPINAFVLNSNDFLRLVIFEAVAILTSTLSGKLKKAYADLERTHAELALANEKLEERIQERTKELSQSNKNLKSEIDQRIAMERAMLDVSNREQRKLGQDLHDGLCQTLSGLKFMTQGLREALAEKSWPETSKMTIIESQLSDALSYVDTISRGLYPVELESNGLLAALEELAEKTSRIYPVMCRFIYWVPISLDDLEIGNHLYRIAQEAVINAVKGGKAKNIHIRLFRRDSNVILSVADDGIGIGNKPLRDGMGIKMMEYRARVIKGSIKFRSRPSGGTIMTCTYTEGLKKWQLNH